MVTAACWFAFNFFRIGSSNPVTATQSFRQICFRCEVVWGSIHLVFAAHAAVCCARCQHLCVSLMLKLMVDLS